MSEVSTFAASLEVEKRSTAFAELVARVTEQAGQAGNLLQECLEATMEDFNAQESVAGSLIERVGGEPLALARLGVVLGVPAAADIPGLQSALMAQPAVEQQLTIDDAIAFVRNTKRDIIREAVNDSLLELGYQPGRIGTAGATYVHNDGTSARVDLSTRGRETGVNLNLDGFSDGRCRQVRAVIVQSLKRRGIKLRTIVRSDVPMAAYTACARKAGREPERA